MLMSVCRTIVRLGLVLLLSMTAGFSASAVAHADPSSGSGDARRPYWLAPGERSEPDVGAAALAAQIPLPPVRPDQMVARAQTWLPVNNGHGVPYSMDRCYPSGKGIPCTPPDYRADCSGYVSMAFGLSQSLVTGELAASWF